MKNLILSILLFTITFSYAQFEAQWELNLQNNNHKEIITLTKNGNTVTGTLIDGGKLNATYNENNNKLNGYFRYNRKMYKFNAFFKNRTKKEMLVGKYCACSGTPTNFISFVKKKNITWQEAETIVFNKNINMQGTWSSDFGILRLHQNGKKITGDYKHVGIINGVLKENKITGTFTNGNKIGIFEWTVISKTEFKGKWAWKGQTLKPSWNATLKSNTKPILKNGSNRTISSNNTTTRRSSLESSSSTNHTTKPKDYSGKYRVTVTNIYTELSIGTQNLKLKTPQNVAVYGTIGIRMKGKTKSSNVEIKSIGSKNPRIWNFSSNNPKKLVQAEWSKQKFITSDPKFYYYMYLGKIEVDKIREFNINGELANSNLMVNIQTNLKESNLLGDDKFGWKQRNLYVKDMQLGIEYLLTMQTVSDDHIAVGFILEKI